MLTYADVVYEVYAYIAYAHVCSRMLTYAHVVYEVYAYIAHISVGSLINQFLSLDASDVKSTCPVSKKSPVPFFGFLWTIFLGIFFKVYL